MSVNAILTAPIDWTQASNANVDRLTIQNIGKDDVEIMGAVGEVTPADSVRGIRIPRSVCLVNVSLAELFPGLTGATRVYVRLQDRDMPGQKSEIFLSHSDA